MNRVSADFGQPPSNVINPVFDLARSLSDVEKRDPSFVVLKYSTVTIVS
jgi:hypothetical protein